MLRPAQYHKAVTQAVATDGRNDYGMYNKVQLISTHWQCTCCNYTLHSRQILSSLTLDVTHIHGE